MASSPLAFAGRLLFALLFLTSGLQKLVTYDHARQGGDIAKFVGTKVDALNNHVQDLAGQKIPIGKEHSQYLLLAAVAIELVGGVFFLLDFTAGAILLLTFLLIATPVIHNFWDEKDAVSQQIEGSQFFKNVALIGALLFYLARPRVVKAKTN